MKHNPPEAPKEGDEEKKLWHITKTRLFKYTEHFNYQKKNENV